jgi:hypothetical protein
MDVKVTGTPLIILRVRNPGGFYRLPGAFDDLLNSFRITVETLAPYVR